MPAYVVRSQRSRLYPSWRTIPALAAAPRPSFRVGQGFSLPPGDHKQSKCIDPTLTPPQRRPDSLS